MAKTAVVTQKSLKTKVNNINKPNVPVAITAAPVPNKAEKLAKVENAQRRGVLVLADGVAPSSAPAGSSDKAKLRKASEGVLVIDVGGTNVKMFMSCFKEPAKVPSGPTMTVRKMVAIVKTTTADWTYDRISIGYPGPIINGRPLREPHNLGGGWVGFDYKKAFGVPVKIMNDASMQALGSYEGGRMLFLGLGTGLGSAMIVDGVLQPMELAHLSYKKGKTYEDYLGVRGLKKSGKKKWRKNVAKITEKLKEALAADYVVLGGGNSKKLKKVPEGARLGKNDNAFKGGFRVWEV
jgi:polyphosphate glucokinase